MRRHVLTVLGYDSIARICLALLELALVRYMDVGPYASYTVAMALVATVAGALVLPFNRVYLIGLDRFAIADRPGAFLSFQLCVGLLAMLALCAVSRIPGLLTASVLLLCLSRIAGDYLKTTYQREMRFRAYSTVELARSAGVTAMVVFLLLLLPTELDAWMVIAVHGGVFAAIAVPLLAREGRSTGLLAVRRGMALGKEILASRYALLFIYFVLLAVLGQVTVLALAWTSDARSVAAYGSAFKYYSLLLMSLNAVHAVLLPTLQQARTIDAVRSVYRRHRQLCYVFVPVACLGIAISGWVIPLVDGGRYPEAVNAFRILAGSSILSFVLSPHATLVLKTERFGFVTVLALIAVAGSAVAAPLAIQALGTSGAALTVLVAYGFMNCGLFVASRRALAALTNTDLPADRSPGK